MMDKSDIEHQAREVQMRIWKKSAEFWPHGLTRLLDMFEPALAAQLLGIKYEEHEELGRFGYGGNQFEVGGLVDRQAGKIAVSKRFRTEVIRFTGAHELGHWVLHPHEMIMHRDRPISGLSASQERRPRKEREADHFAACFLMPRKLVRKKFQETFEIDQPFVFNDETAFWLQPDDPDSLLRPVVGSKARGLVLASTESYRGRHFISLAKQFRVSVASMAIRLEELGLFEEV